MSTTKLTGKVLPHEVRRELHKAPLSPLLPTEPLPQGARAVIKPDQDASEIVIVDGERRRTSNLMNENYIPVIGLMTDLPHGVHYANGERRLLDAGGGNYRLIIFRRTGVAPDAGEWLDYGLSAGVMFWP